MTAIIKGHGARINDEKTFVPQGVTLRFYSNSDVNLATSVALIALLDGAQAPAQEVITGTGTVGDVDNYVLGTQDDGFYAKWMALGGELDDARIWWVGTDIPDGTRLCENPETCPGLGEHTCTGALGYMEGQSEIVILACRGYVKDPAVSSERDYGTDPNHPQHSTASSIGEMVTYALGLAKTNPGEAEAYVDSIDQGTIGLMINRKDFAAWQLARRAKEYAAANDLQQLFGHLRANQNRLDDIMQWLDEVPSYGAAIDTVARNYPDTFAAWLYQYDVVIPKALLARPAIKTAVANLRAGT